MSDSGGGGGGGGVTAAFRPGVSSRRRSSPSAVPLLLALVACALLAAVRCSVDEFQCACGHNARRHVQTARAALDADDAVAAADAAVAYGALVRRMLSVACDGQPEPTARWLWLLDLYADDARRLFGGGDDDRYDDDDNGGGGGGDGKTARERRLSEAVDLVSDELDRYVRICEARRLAVFARRWSRAEFERYLLERVTAARAADAGKDAAAVGDEARFEPCRLYLDDVAAGGAAALADVAMPKGVGVDWADAADRLAGLYRVARRKGVSGTRELVLYQKKFASAVVATAMAHVLVHVTHCQEHWRNGGGGGGSGSGSGGDNGQDGGARSDGGDDGSSYVGEYERTWMSVGGLLDKFRAFLGVRSGARGHFKALADVAGNPVRDADGFHAVKRAIRAQIADVGAGLFGPARSANVPTIVKAVGGASEGSSALIDLIALVDNNIGAAERYLATVQAALPGVDFRIINKFMRSTHIWLT